MAPPATAQREFERLIAIETDECIEWTRYIAPDGYGRLNRHGQIYAHRAALIDTAGPPPPGTEACHSTRCVSRACINPRHLRWDTMSSNQIDRHATNTANGKLTAEQVHDIRQRLTAGELQADIARLYDVHQSIISNIKHKKLWAWLAEKEGTK